MPKPTKAVSKCLKTQNSSDKQVQSQNHAHLLFQQLWSGPQEVCSNWAAVNQVFYRDVFERFQNRVNRVHLEITKTGILHHDNALSHCAFNVTQFLTSKKIAILPQLLYSLDLYSCDFFLFLEVKKLVKRSHFESINNVQEAATSVLLGISVEAFQNSYND